MRPKNGKKTWIGDVDEDGVPMKLVLNNRSSRRSKRVVRG